MASSRHSNQPRIWLFLRIVLAAGLFLSQFQPQSPVKAAPNPQSASPEDRAQALFSSLSTAEEKVGQLFLVTFQGTDAGSNSQIFDLITNHHVGGVILQAGNDNFAPQPQTLSELTQLIRQLQTDEWSATQSNQIDPITNEEFRPAFIPLFIGVSQEGDIAPNDQIIPSQGSLTPLPSEMAIGATWNPELARKVGVVTGSELASMGFNLLLGPSLDVLETPQQLGTGDLGVRTFGGDPYWVGEMGRAYISGVHEGSAGRMAVVGKHFPGYGSSDRLPEEEVSTVRKSLEQLNLTELPPFFAVTGNAPSSGAAVDALLVSHIRYQGFQGNIRATTNPVSLDPQAFSQLMSLPAFAAWRENGGLMISDNLGSLAFRRFKDPTGTSFNARIIARDAFLTGNDLLFLGSGFVANSDPDSYPTILRTLDLFAQKYREDPAFAQLVDISVLRILTMKYRLYSNIFTLAQVLPNLSATALSGEASQTTFEVAQAAATLINPSLEELGDTLPEPPGLNDRILFITDERTMQQCSDCPEINIFGKNALEQAIIRLYGPLAGGQVLQRNLSSYSFTELIEFLDAPRSDEEPPPLSTDIQQADWIVVAMLNVSTSNPTSLALSRFLAERPDLFRQKNLIVFAFNAPYYLDATEISKLTAYFGLYSKAPQFIEVAARLLFGEIPAPQGNLPVSVPGVGYDLISFTAPDPNQTIPLTLDQPQQPVAEGTPTPEPPPAPEFEIGDLLALRTGIILDHNGHPVPDGTPVQFIMSSGGDVIASPQIETTKGGIARTTFLIDQSGRLEFRVESEPAMQSTVLAFDIAPVEGEIAPTEAAPQPTENTDVEPTPTALAALQETPSPPRTETNLTDWFMALLVTFALGLGIYYLMINLGAARWGVRGSFLSLIGGLLAYTYLALGLPGSAMVVEEAGSWGVLLVTILGSTLGWGTAWGWQAFENNHNRSLQSADQSSDQA